MTGKEWAVPLVLGLVAAGGLWALVAGSDGGDDGGDGPAVEPGSTTAPTTGAPSPLLLPFRDSWGVDGRTTSHLFIAPSGRAAAEAHINASGDRDFAPGAWTWQGERVALYSGRNLFAGCQESPPGSGQRICSDPAWVTDSQPPSWPFPRTYALPANDTGPRLFEAGYNATKVTAFVFDEAGELLASNAAADQVAQFAKREDYVRLPTTAWYLGANGTAPNGTAHLPGFAQPLVDKVRPELGGLPERGVASTRSNAYVALYGTLFVTIRVDELVHAP